MYFHLNMKPPHLFAACCCHAIIAQMPVSANPISYQNPPTYVQYVEGEDAFEQNWTPGESRHFWWKGYANVTGRGLLELAASKLPEAGSYTAKYHFEIPEDGTWCIYARTRYPGFIASPFHWQVDDGPLTRQPQRDEMIQENIVAEVINQKMALVRLGPFKAKKGTRALAVSVRDFATDGLPYISQAIDGFSVSHCEVVPFPDSQAVGLSLVTFNAKVDPLGSEFPGIEIPLAVGDWRYYKNLIVSAEVVSQSSEPFEGRLRVYRRDGTFTDLMLSIPPAEFGAARERAFDLQALLPKDGLDQINALRLFTNDKWYAAAQAYTVKVGVPQLSGKTDDAPATQVLEPKSGMPAPAKKDAAEGASGAFVWNDASNTGGFSKANSGNNPDFVFAHHADGKSHEARIEFLPAPAGGEVNPGVERRRFKLTNTSESVIYRVDFAYQAPIAAKSGEFFGGSQRYDLHEMPALESLLGPQKLTHDWVCLAADGTTVYTYLEDEAHNDSRLDFCRDEKEGIRWNFSKFVRIKPGETWVSPVIVTGRHEGQDWHPSADAFSKWWFSWAATPKIPEWFRSIGGMGVGLNYPANGRTTDLEHQEAQQKQATVQRENNRAILAAARDRIGITWWHNGAWLPLGTEGWYPNGYRINGQQTGNLRKLTDDVRAAGGKTSFYTNPLMLSRVSSEFPELKDRMQVIDLDGFPVYTEHTHRHHPMALVPADREWGRKFAEIILPVVRDARPDALYMDQLGAVPIHLDWSENLPESRLGLWTYNQGQFCQEVIDELKSVNPDIVTGIECVNAYAQQYITYALLFYADYPVLRYTFPSYTSMVGRYEELDAEKLVGYAEVALLTGQPFICINDPLKIPESAAKRIKEIITIKRSLDPLLYTLRYRDTVGLRVDEGIDASCFVGEKGVKVIVAVNRSKERKSITIGDGSLEIVRKWGAEQTTLSEGHILQLPPESLSAVELNEKR